MSRVTLRERFFALHLPDDVDRFLARFAWAVVFKAGTSDKTVDAWLVAQNALEPLKPRAARMLERLSTG